MTVVFSGGWSPQMDYPGGPSQCKLYFDGAIDGKRRISILMFFVGDISVRVSCYLFWRNFCAWSLFSRAVMSMAVHGANQMRERVWLLSI
jgi:hypothetical protein